MATGGKRICQSCRALLARDHHDVLCGPCRRRSGLPPLPPGFYTTPRLRAALANYDFSVVFKAVRTTLGLSQSQFAELLGLDQPRVSDIERGTRRIRDIGIVAHVSRTLAIAPVLLGFPAATVENSATTARKGEDDMERRQFVGNVAKLVLASSGAAMAGVDLDRLIGLLPDTHAAATQRVGAADVDAIEATTAAFMRSDFAHGSALTRDGAVSQLRSVLPLLNARVTPEVMLRLKVAIAELALIAGWMSFDTHHGDDARRLWMIGLDVVRGTGEPLGTDLGAYLAYDMALQATDTGQPGEGLKLVHLSQAIASEGPVSAATRSCLAAVQARAHAALGNKQECLRSLGQARESFHEISTETSPRWPWTAHTREAGLAGYEGITRYTLATRVPDPAQAGRAVDLLDTFVAGVGPDYARIRARYLPVLASAHVASGDLPTAVTVGHHAVNAAATVSSARVTDTLRDLHTTLGPVTRSPGVEELRERLVAA